MDFQRKSVFIGSFLITALMSTVMSAVYSI